MLPNHGTMRSSHTAQLLFPFLPPEACEAHLFPSLASGSLISIGLLCDHGCTALFTATSVTIKCGDNVVCTGQRSSSSGLWCLDLTPASAPVPAAPLASVAAARDLIHALQHPSLASPLAPIGDSHHAALQQLAEIFSQVTDATTQMPEDKRTDVPSLDIAPDLASAVTPPRVSFAQDELQAVEPPAAPPIAAAPATGAAPPRVVLAHDAGHPRVNEEGATHPRVDEDGFTYVNRTTNPGRRRRQAKKAAKASKTAPPAPTIIAQRHLPTAKVPAPDAVAQDCPKASILRRSRFATPEVSDPTTAAAPVQTQSPREPPATSPHGTRSRTRNARLKEARQHVATGHSANAAATLLAHQLGDEPDSFRASMNAVVDPVTGMELDY